MFMVIMPNLLVNFLAISRYSSSHSYECIVKVFLVNGFYLLCWP